MKTRKTIFWMMVLATGLAAAPPVPPKKSAAPKPRAALFFGSDSANWLPKSSTMPTAAMLEQLAGKLSSRMRNVDPFGIATFPREDAAPLFHEDVYRPAQRVTLNQALQTLKVNGLNLAQKEFLVGGRSVFQGDMIELAFRGEIFKALVVEVGPTQILFRDLEREETGVMPHRLVPQLRLEPLQPGQDALEGRMTAMEHTDTPTRK